MSKLIYVIAGDTSGDEYTADLIRKVHHNNSDIKFEGIAGDLAEAQGIKLWEHSKNLNFMGVLEVCKNYKIIKKTWTNIKTRIQENKPDLLILIDYPGLNLKVAKWAKKQGVTIIYYIPPQVWCWKKGRIKSLKKYIDFIAPLYPHESNFFKEKGVTHYNIKHLGLDKIRAQSLKDITPARPINILCMPGSRKEEIDNNLPEMLTAISSWHESSDKKYSFEIFIIKAQSSSNLESICSNWSKLKINIIPYYQKKLAFDKAHVACVTSGTAALEVALAAIPLVVIYKTNLLFKLIIKYIVKANVKWISLPNLISQKTIITEIKESKIPEGSIQEALIDETLNSEKRNKTYNDLLNMRSILNNFAEFEIENLIELAIKNNPSL